jgi:hypothetical protein
VSDFYRQTEAPLWGLFDRLDVVDNERPVKVEPKDACLVHNFRDGFGGVDFVVGYLVKFGGLFHCSNLLFGGWFLLGFVALAVTIYYHILGGLSIGFQKFF